MKNILLSIFGGSLLAFGMSVSFGSCNDDPTDENYYTFTGEMMSDYLQNRKEFSEFAEIVERAGLMPQLSAYGHYTCFAPTNDAMNNYLQRKGKTMDMLTDADCDTIARTHLIGAMYSTFEMSEAGLPTQNMMNRSVKIGFDTDEDNNTIIVVNRTARIRFQTQNDSVENGIMQPVTAVMESSTLALPDLMQENESISFFSQALEATGLADDMRICEDASYVNTKEKYSYTSGAEPMEFATPPDYRKIGFTAFVVPDSILKEKYHVNEWKDLYKIACDIYDPIYPEDVASEGHSINNLRDPKNPLRRFMGYHVLSRNIQRLSDLTVRGNFGVRTKLMNPVDWYPTLLPYTMIKAERITVTKYIDESRGDVAQDYYLNRRCDDLYEEPGVHVIDVDTLTENLALNGLYLYTNDILKFDATTRDVIDNCRMRIDFSSVFPELMSNNLRMNGDMTNGGTNGNTAADNEDTKYGRNYFFPDGYLDGVTVGSNGYFIYRRPRTGYWSLHGDEFVCQGNFDITFRIPPVPFTGEWQIRLGYAAMAGRRGVAQIYFGDSKNPYQLKPQGIPLDMNNNLQVILGSWTAYNSYKTAEEKEKLTDVKKTLKNKGYRFGCDGGYHGTNTDNAFSDEPSTLRIVLCTVKIEQGKDYYLRVRAVSENKGSNNNEAMLDYLELVPKSVYGVSDEGSEEDDL